MSDQIFLWTESLADNSGDYSFVTASNKFGDGYEQSISIGINNRKGSWAFSKTGKEQEIIEIKKFLDFHKGADSFFWISPQDGLVKVKSENYQLVYRGANTWRISTTFKQQF